MLLKHPEILARSSKPNLDFISNAQTTRFTDVPTNEHVHVCMYVGNEHNRHTHTSVWISVHTKLQSQRLTITPAGYVVMCACTKMQLQVSQSIPNRAAHSLVDLLQVPLWHEQHPSTTHSNLTDEGSNLKGRMEGRTLYIAYIHNYRLYTNMLRFLRSISDSIIGQWLLLLHGALMYV